MTDTPLDFEKVELVRDKMRLTKGDMARLFGVSRVTYHRWADGGPIRTANADKAKEALRKLLPLVLSGAWPPEGAASMSSAQRMDRLLELMGQSE